MNTDIVRMLPLYSTCTTVQKQGGREEQCRIAQAVQRLLLLNDVTCMGVSRARAVAVMELLQLYIAMLVTLRDKAFNTTRGSCTDINKK